MSKQKTYQKFVYKIHSSRILSAPKKNLQLTLEEARKNDEIISMSDREVLRFIDDINELDTQNTEIQIRNIRRTLKKLKRESKSPENYKKIRSYYAELDKLQIKSDYVCIIMDKPSDFKKLNHGFKINDIEYKRLVGTPNGVKKSTVVYASVVNANGKIIHEELQRRLDNNRDLSVKLVPAKFEAYKSLACSASTPVSMPNGVLVVDDLIVHFKENVINLDDGKTDEPIMTVEEQELELNASDGYGIMCPTLAERWSEEMNISYIMPGACARNSFFKGMIFTFDFHAFCNEFHGSENIADVWGNVHNINDIELIVTTSMLKLWDSYKSIEDYLGKSTANGYSFALTKVLPDKLENERNLNYQFIQSYELNDDQIRELISPTVNEIKDIIGGDINKTILFLKGMSLNEQNVSSIENDFAKAVMIDPRMLHDDYVINRINYMIKKRITEAKIGVLKIHGNYATISGDPFALCQKIFKINVPENEMGLLKAGEIYSEYWADLGAKEIVCFRAPMSCHNNIKKMKVINNTAVHKWYKYMNTVNIVNAHDSFCAAENGADFDGDALITTDNKVLLENTRELPTIICIQRKAEKKLITEELLADANQSSFGDAIGTTTNHITAMYDVMSMFDKNSEEHKIISYRIMCGQLYQQEAIDKTKGIIAKSMPKHWYTLSKNQPVEGDSEADIKLKQFNTSICAEKKPYFMNYIYPDQMAEYNKYIKNTNKKCKMIFRMSVDELINKETRTPEEENFVEWYNKMMPVSQYPSVMNRLCKMIEQEFAGYITEVKKKQDFDYTIMKSGVEYSLNDYYKIKKIYDNYIQETLEYQKQKNRRRYDIEDASAEIFMLKERFRRECISVCTNEYELCDIILDMCYRSNHSKHFAWEMCGDTIIHNLLKLNNNTITYLYKCNDGDVEFGGEKFSVGQKVVDTNDDNE